MDIVLTIYSVKLSRLSESGSIFQIVIQWGVLKYRKEILE